jgi:hypothetical protein
MSSKTWFGAGKVNSPRACGGCVLSNGRQVRTRPSRATTINSARPSPSQSAMR